MIRTSLEAKNRQKEENLWILAEKISVMYRLDYQPLFGKGARAPPPMPGDVVDSACGLDGVKKKIKFDWYTVKKTPGEAAE